jgi:hypothetical protein
MEVHTMKRDLELARQLLLDIEANGADCSVSALRIGTAHEPSIHHATDERIRYHLRLLIDAGLLKEVDRTAAGVPCVRLTHEGHELLELTRNETLWREAQQLCLDRTGGLSLSAIRTLLTRMAAAPRMSLPRARRRFVGRRPYLEYETDNYRVEPLRYLERDEEREYITEGRVRYVRVPYDSADHLSRPVRYVLEGEEDRQLDWEYDSSYPSHLI